MMKPGETNPDIRTSADEAIAEEFIGSELRSAKTSLRITQVASILGVAIIGIYMVVVTKRFESALEPQEAATIVQGMVQQRVTDFEPEFASYLKREVPAYISRVPDYALQKLPSYRAQLEDEVEASIRNYAQKTSADLGTHLDEYLVAHKDQVKDLILIGQDRTASQVLGADMKEMFLAYLDESQLDGESLRDKLGHSLLLLGKTEERMRRIKRGIDLTPSEKKARHAIAILLHQIETARENSDPIVLPEIDKGVITAGLDTPADPMLDTGTGQPVKLGAVGSKIKAKPVAASPAAKPGAVGSKIKTTQAVAKKIK